MGYDTIHETAISTIVDAIKNGIGKIDDNMSKFRSSNNAAIKSGSITQATKGLIMEFPVLISKANHIESAAIVAKAYEAKFVTLLHLAFAACGVSNEKNGMEFLRGFHTNLDKKMSVDDFINFMDGYDEKTGTFNFESTITADTYSMIKAVTEDMKNLNYYFGDDIKESSLDSYKILNNYGITKVIQEAEDPFENVAKREYEKQKMENDETRTRNDSTRTRDDMTRTYNDTLRTRSQLNKNRYEKQRDQERDQYQRQRDQENLDRELITNYIVSSDLKKANELTPTMMIINFKSVAPNGETINNQMVVGVKAKLYEVEPMDVINKIISKNVDSNILLKLIKVSTREVSFVKDFLFAIDSAKLDALSGSKRGSTNKLFKVLERRALGGKIRKKLKMNDYCKAISSLVISQEEAEELLKNNIDVTNPGVIRPIMEKLNLISFAIIDESSESVRFIFDTGDDVYETIPLSKLEKEQRDGMSKKVINLIAKMNR